jgi:hypothetical protein
MRFTVKYFCSKLVGFVPALIALLAVSSFSHGAFAEGAFIQQASTGSSSGRPVTFGYPLPQAPTTSSLPHSGITPSTPETAAPVGGGNFASTLEVGQFNHVFQAQAGAGNVSNVGIVGGAHNNVGVVQAGRGLVSNLLLVNTTGLSVGVIQPNGSVPVNMLIAGLPNGGLLIKR